tara:strand:+ start:20 stop:556 length:537 start_codon:yes stop_codon:yes gene_type:complete
MSKRQRLSTERFEYTKGDEHDYERSNSSFSFTNEEEDSTIIMCNKSTQTQEECNFEKRVRKPTVLKTKTDTATYRTRFKESFCEWKKDDEWTPFLGNFSKKELKEMGYDVNVRYSIDFLTAELKYIKSKLIQCPICYSYPDNPIVLNCGHSVCSKCSPKLIDCPMCRLPIYDEIKMFH